MRTVSGARASRSLLERLKLASLESGALSVTIPVTAKPPTAGAGSSVNETSPAGHMVRGVLRVVPSQVAESVAVRALDAGRVVTGKVASVSPAGTVTLS